MCRPYKNNDLLLIVQITPQHTFPYLSCQWHASLRIFSRSSCSLQANDVKRKSSLFLLLSASSVESTDPTKGHSSATDGMKTLRALTVTFNICTRPLNGKENSLRAFSNHLIVRLSNFRVQSQVPDVSGSIRYSVKLWETRYVWGYEPCRKLALHI